ncbi:MAG: SMP-30/gluconolactonase/LRE family protein [Caldilineaceae bacterium]|nr:SMP-30/gluconolactonase/LRE family protein [Caldilineaceae bacterium]
MNRLLLKTLSLSLLLISLLMGVQVSASAQGEIYLVEYEVSGSPLNVAVEAPGRIWYTLPDEGKIGLIEVSGNSATETLYPLQGNSEPYDLVVRRGKVWFTDRTRDRIGALTISSGSFTYYAAAAGSAPTAIDVMPNGTVWFVESATATLTELNPAGGGTFTRHAYPQSNAELGDLDIINNAEVWVTATNRNELAAFDTTVGEFLVEQTSGPSGTLTVDGPRGIAVDDAGRPWMTIMGGNGNPSLIARYAPATTFRIRTTPTGTPNAEPAQIAFHNADPIWYLFYSEAAVGKVARLAILPNGAIGGTVEASVGDSAAAPWGAAVDANGQAWFAVQGNNTIVGWQPPYADPLTAYLPIISR